MDNQILVELTADIVSAHVSHNAVAGEELPTVIQKVFGALAAAGTDPVEPEKALEPAVSIRSSVKPDAVTCLECGKKMKMLKRHLSIDHNLTPDSYRTRWNLPRDYPMTAPDYAAKRKDLAVKIGLGRKPAATATTAPKKKAVAKKAS